MFVKKSVINGTRNGIKCAKKFMIQKKWKGNEYIYCKE